MKELREIYDFGQLKVITQKSKLPKYALAKLYFGIGICFFCCNKALPFLFDFNQLISSLADIIAKIAVKCEETKKRTIDL